MTREFIIQRYATGLWPAVRGLRPFVVTGPSFMSWVIPGSLASAGRWLLRPAALTGISGAFPVGRTHRGDLLVVAEVLLRDGIVDAFWSTDSLHCLPLEQRWDVALDEVAAEVIGRFATETADPFHMAAELAWGLGTLGGIEHVRDLLSDDGLTVERTAIPEIEKSPASCS